MTQPAELDPKEHQKRAGLLLAKYRKAKGVSRDQLNEKLGVSLVSSWESGRNAIDPSRLHDIAEILTLTERQAGTLKLHVQPALRTTWLAAQDEDKRAGLLLRAYRRQKGFSQDEAAEKLEMPRGTYDKWESGKIAIKPSRLADIASTFDLTHWEARKLTLARLPALNPAWLANKPVEKRGGLVLTDYRERKGLTLGDLSKILQTSTVPKWEQGIRKIPQKYHNKLVSALGLEGSDHKKEREYLLNHIYQSNEAIKNHTSGITVESTDLGAASKPGIMDPLSEALPDTPGKDSPGKTPSF